MAGLFDRGVVGVALQHQVRQRGGPTGLPGNHMVGVEQLGWGVAAREHAAAVAGDQGGSQFGADQPPGAADVQDDRGTAEHDRDQLRVTAGPAQFPGR